MEKHTITISANLGGGSSFTKNIYVPFVPDSMSVKSVVYAHDGTENGVSGIRCNELVPNQILGMINDGGGSIIHAPVTFDIHHAVAGQYTLELLDVVGALENRAGDLFLTFEFSRNN